MPKYEKLLYKAFVIVITLSVAVIGYWIKDVHSKVNDGVFVRVAAYEEKIKEIRENRKEADEKIRRELCDRLKRIEDSIDLLLQDRIKRPEGGRG